MKNSEKSGNKRNYFDIDIDFDIWLKNCGSTEELFWLKDLILRKFYLNYAIDQDGIHEIARYILQYNAEDANAGIPPDERQPILIYIASNGGEVDSGFELIDIIEQSSTPVYTVNLGYEYSMGFLIGLAGHRRYALPNAKFLMHDGTNFVWDSGTKAQDKMEFNKLQELRIRDYVLAHSGVTPEEYDSKLRVEWYMFADEAKKNGFVDYIIGEDCPLEAVI